MCNRLHLNVKSITLTVLINKGVFQLSPQLKTSHRKHLAALFVSLSLLFVTGCQSASQLNIDTEKLAENRQADSKVFSSKDLIYFVLTDRFKDGSAQNNQFSDYNPKDPRSYHGGDFVGLTQSLDYIESLGTTAIWITPIVENEAKGYHGYWATNFEKIDPHLGTEDELRTLVAEAHKRNIKIILDYVVNHTGYTSPWLSDPDKTDWFHPKQDIVNWSDPSEVENKWLMGLPDLNTENSEVNDYFIKNALSWIEKTGVDGMRLDTMRHVPKAFWTEFSSAIHSKYPDFYLLGEVWNDNTRYLQLYQDSGINGLTNYSLYNGITATFSRSGSSSSLTSAIQKEKFFKTPQLNGIFIDNHDNPRYVSVSGKAYTKQALAFIMTYPAIPIIYYGTELGMEGKGDPDNRRDMTWDTVNEQNAMLQFYKQLTAIRQSVPAITEGQITTYKSSKDVVLYSVLKDGKGVLVAMNLRNNTLNESVDLKETLKLGQILMNENGSKSHINGAKLDLELGPNDILILNVNQ